MVFLLTYIISFVLLITYFMPYDEISEIALISLAIAVVLTGIYKKIKFNSSIISISSMD